MARFSRRGPKKSRKPLVPIGLGHAGNNYPRDNHSDEQRSEEALNLPPVDSLVSHKLVPVGQIVSQTASTHSNAKRIPKNSFNSEGSWFGFLIVRSLLLP